MKKILLALSVFMTLLAGDGCIKSNDCTNKTVQSEQATIVNYAAANGITATAHSSGLYYQVITPGSGPSPTTSSTVVIKYIGKLLDGTVFDSQTVTSVTIPLSQVIQGWQIGLPLLHKGGSIKLIIPSALAYGCSGYGTIPGNAILYFEIDLLDVM